MYSLISFNLIVVTDSIYRYILLKKYVGLFYYSVIMVKIQLDWSIKEYLRVFKSITTNILLCTLNFYDYIKHSITTSW